MRHRNNCVMCEALESRRLLAGNVVVTLFGSVATRVTIVGDKKSNDISVVAAGDGYHINGNAGTTINGFPGVVIPISIQTFQVNMDAGDDHAVFSNIQAVTAQFALGNGNDNLELDQSTITTLTIDAGSGDDTVLLSQVSSVSSSVGVDIDAGAGNDHVTLDRVNIHGSLSVRLGAGNDLLRSQNPNFLDFGIVDVGGPVILDGGRQTDTLDLQAGMSFNTIATITGFESTIIP